MLVKLFVRLQCKLSKAYSFVPASACRACSTDEQGTQVPRQLPQTFRGC